MLLLRSDTNIEARIENTDLVEAFKGLVHASNTFVMARYGQPSLPTPKQFPSENEARAERLDLAEGLQGPIACFTLLFEFDCGRL